MVAFSASATNANGGTRMRVCERDARREFEKGSSAEMTKFKIQLDFIMMQFNFLGM